MSIGWVLYRSLLYIFNTKCCVCVHVHATNASKIQKTLCRRNNTLYLLRRRTLIDITMAKKDSKESRQKALKREAYQKKILLSELKRLKAASETPQFPREIILCHINPTNVMPRKMSCQDVHERHQHPKRLRHKRPRHLSLCQECTRPGREVPHWKRPCRKRHCHKRLRPEREQLCH